MSDKKCCGCAHFRQHYILDSQQCTTVHCGHCTYPRVKHRKSDTPACEYFEECADRDLPDREKVVSYLTTEFLEEILKMQLPPEIAAEDEGFDSIMVLPLSNISTTRIG